MMSPDASPIMMITMMERATPLLQMSSDELVRAYMTPLSFGLYLSFFFYGMFLLAVYLYFTQFKVDIWLNRGVVTLLLCLTTADTIAGAMRVFKMTVANPNNLPYVLDVTQRPEDWLCTVMLLITVLVSQLFMSYRIVSFARHMAAWDEGKRAKAKIWMMAGALGVGWIACLSACIANMVVFYRVTNYMQLLLPTNIWARIFRGTSLVMPVVLFFMDVLIAVLMSIQYRKAKTGFGVSNHILNVLVNVIIRNGAMMAAIMLVQLLVTIFAVLWANFMPMFYGKLHALTIVCILTEPRVAKSRWYRSQGETDPSSDAVPVPGGLGAGVGPGGGAGGGAGGGGSGPGGQGHRMRQIQTPHMDYSWSADGPGARPDSSSTAAVRMKGYSPAFPYCAQCHAPWLPSDMDRELLAAGDDSSSASASAAARGSSGYGSSAARLRHPSSAATPSGLGRDSRSVRSGNTEAGWTDERSATVSASSGDGSGPGTMSPLTEQSQSPPLMTASDKESLDGGYFGAYLGKAPGGLLGNDGLLVVEENENEATPRMISDQLLVAVLPRVSVAREFSFAEALKDLDDTSEDGRKP